MNTYEIVVKHIMISETEFQDDIKDLDNIQNILARDKCVIIGNKLYTFDNIVTIKQISNLRKWAV